MPQSLARVYLHLVFSTKNRYPWLAEAGVRTELHRYLAACSNELKCAALEVGGVADHVHVLAELARTIAIADWVKEVKRVSSAWAKTRLPPDGDGFGWQNGYGVFSISERNLAVARAYVQQQEAHHRQESFQDEYRRLLRAHGLTWDEAHVWD